MSPAFKTLPGTQQVKARVVRPGRLGNREQDIWMETSNNFFYTTPGICCRDGSIGSCLKGTIFSSGGYFRLVANQALFLGP